MREVVAAIKRDGKEYCLEACSDYTVSRDTCAFYDPVSEGCSGNYEHGHICTICKGIYYKCGVSGGWAWREI